MIQINAKQQKQQFVKNGPVTWKYIMHVDQYSKLDQQKVLEEAAAHSGIAKGALKGAWDAIGEVIKNWVTEGHSVTIPGLGSIRFGVRAQAVEDVNDVAKSLITSRRVIFTPNVEIVNALKATSVQITCIDKDGNIVKRTTDVPDLFSFMCISVLLVFYLVTDYTVRHHISLCGAKIAIILYKPTRRNDFFDNRTQSGRKTPDGRPFTLYIPFMNYILGSSNHFT